MEKILLKNGHSDDIYCIDCNSQRLISGGEKGEVVLWEKKEAVKKLKISDDEIYSLCFSKETNSSHVYGSYKNVIFMLDLRNSKNVVWKQECYSDSNDDINQISINKSNEYLAIANETNHVYTMKISDHTIMKMRGHTSASCCVRFRDGSSFLQFVSGDYKCSLVNWNGFKKKPYQKFNIADSVPQNSTFVNPPHVLSVSFNKDYSKLACGIGNGTVKIFNCCDRSMEYSETLDSYAHTNSVSQVQFLNSSNHVLVSGGNDCKLNIWDLNNYESEQKPKSTIFHGKKVNWITTMNDGNNDLIVVCDTSPDVTCYAV